MTQQKYNRHQIPPDWDLATNHMRATRPGKHISIAKEDFRYVLCPCCCSYVDKLPYSYFEADKQLFFLGEGFPLFYNTVKFTIVMMVLLLLDSSAIEVVINYTSYLCAFSPHAPAPDSSDDADGIVCQDSIFNYLSNSNMVTTFPQYRNLLRICGFLGQLLLLLHFRDSQSVLSKTLDQRNCTISDYSIMISGIPKSSNNNQQKIRNILNREKLTTKQVIEKEIGDNVEPSFLNIQEILLLSNLQQYYQYQKQLEEIIERRLKSMKDGNDAIQGIFQAEQKEIEKKIKELVLRMNSKQEKYFSGQAIIVFNHQDERDEAIEYMNGPNEERDSIIKENYPEYDPDRDPIKVIKAHQPQEIIWENSHVPYKERITSIAVGWLLTIGLLSIATVSVYFLINYKAELVEEHTSHDNNFLIAYAIGISITVFINILNKFVLAPILHIITQKYQKHQEFSSLEYSFALKYVVSMFFTTALMVLIVEGIIFHNYTGTMGLTSEETFMFAFNAYFSPIVMIINPYFIVYWIKRKIHYGSKNMTQEQANKLMQYPQYNVGKRYAQILKTVWFTFLYAELIPVGTLLSCTGLILYYLVDKYALLRKSSINGNISSSIAKDMFPIMQIALIIKPVGEFLFQYQIRQTLSIESFVMIAVAVVYILLPKDKLMQCCCIDNYFKQANTYKQSRGEMKHTYHTIYPVHKYESQLKLYKSKPMFVFCSQDKKEKEMKPIPQSESPYESTEHVLIGQKNQNNHQYNSTNSQPQNSNTSNSQQ